MNFISKLTAFVFFSAMLLLGCGTESTNNDPDSGPEFKLNDHTFRLRLPADARFMNPGYFRGYEYFVLTNIFPMLMDFDPQTMEMAPVLVKSAPTMTEIVEGPNAGGQAIAFEIHDQAVWDDGKPVTGHDFAFTIKALFNPKVPSDHIIAYLGHIYDIEVDTENPKKFTVLTREKYILAEPTIANCMPMPKHIYDPTNLMGDFAIPDLTDPEKVQKLADDPKITEFATQFTSPKYNRETVSGCGPYKFVEWIDKQRIVLAKKDNWWGDQLADKYPMLTANPDTLVFLPIRDDNAVIAAIKDEAVDGVFSINSNLFDELKENEAVAERYNFYSPDTYNFFYSVLNTKSPKLSDQKVRRALAHLLEMDKLIEVLYAGYGQQIAHPFPPDAEYYRTDLKPIPYDLETAANLLEEAGWKDSDNNGIRDKMIDGEKVELSLSYLNSGTLFSKNLSAAMEENARKVGMEIKSEEISFASIVRERLPAREFEIAGLQGAADPLASLDPKQLWHTDSDTPSGTNRAGFGNAETDALIDEIRQTLDVGKRNELLGELQEIIYNEQPWLLMFTPKERIVIHKRWKGEASNLKPGIHARLMELKKVPQ